MRLTKSRANIWILCKKIIRTDLEHQLWAMAKIIWYELMKKKKIVNSDKDSNIKLLQKHLWSILVQIYNHFWQYLDVKIIEAIVLKK